MRNFYNYSKFLLLLIAMSFVSISNAQCDISVTVSSAGWGDVTTWELRDGSGNPVLTGGTYGFGYTDNQTTVGSNPPYSLFFSVNNANFCDNEPEYSVTVGGAPDISGIVSVGCVNDVVTIPLNSAFVGCSSVQPPTPDQDPALPTCITGALLSISGSPATNNVWYWQTSASGTSTANPVSGTYAVFNNGTYYANSLNTVTNVWSTASSVVVSNIPVATAPPAPVATVDPSCASTGSTLTMTTPPAGTEYYWQGTTVNGTSTALNASSPYAYSVSGTYYVSAFETSTQCWSVTTPVTVTVDTYIPVAPTAAVDNFNICAGATTLEISASPATETLTTTVASGAINQPIPDSNPTGTSSVLEVSNIPFGSTVTGISVNLNITHTWNSDVDIFLIGANGTQIELSTDNGGSADNYVNTTFSSAASTLITAGTSPFTGTFLPEGNLSLLFSQGNGNWTLKVADDTGGDIGVLQNWSITLSYTPPAPSISWFDASTAGNNIGNGSTLETVGSSVLSNPATFGNYEFYAAAVSGGCESSTRTLVTVNVANTNAVLTPVNVTCNGGNNGSFTLGAIECGVEPFEYSLDGGVTFGPIPTDLTAGTYQVIINDANDLQSAPIEVVVAQPSAPSNITVDANYFSADVSWSTTGDETSWTIEYGPTGFTPGTGTIETATSSPFTMTGLVEDTEYDVYVTADCGANSEAGGPATFSTNSGFFTYDNACGPGFNDISTTGNCQDLGDDLQFDFTMPWTWDYQGLPVNTLSIDNNGGISFVSNAGVPFSNNTIATAANGLYPYWDDLFSNGGSVCTQVVGTSPNQQVIIQWNVDDISFDGTDLQFQVVIEEATGEVYFIYENTITGNSLYDNGADATIGAAGPQTDVQVSFNSPTYLQNNSCVHFYNALCPNPVNPVVTAFQEEVIIEWTAGLYGETEWTVIYGPAGFDPATEGTTLTASSPNVNILGLTQLTDYDVYIYSECMLDNLTSPGLLVEFQTLPWCNTPTALAGVTEVDSLFAVWSWSEVSGAPNALSGFNIQYGDFGFELYNGTLEVADGLDNADTIANQAFLAGGVYQVYVQAVCGVDTSNYAGPYTFVMPLSNDSVCGAEMLSVDGTVYYFNNTGATVDLGENGIIPSGSNPDGYNNTNLPQLTWGVPVAEGSTWFTFEAPASGSMWFSGNDENFFASQIAIYEVVDCGDFSSFELVAASDQVNEDITSKIAPNFTICGLTPGQTYYIMHDAWSNGFGGPPTFGQYSIRMTEIILDAGSYVDILDVCSGGSVELFDGITGYDNDGVWSAELPSAETQLTGSEWNSAGFAYEIFNFEYRLTDGCAFDTTFAKVRVWAPSNAGTDGSLTVCRNQPFDLLAGLNGTVDLGGTWFNPSLQELSSSAIVASNIPGQFNYYYVAGNGICPNDTSLVLVNVQSTCDYLDVEEMYFGTMTIMPNPSNGVFNINNTGSTEVFNYTVTDVDGRVILTKDTAINGTETTVVDLTDMVTGIYMIRVYNDNAEQVFRVIKQ